MQTAGWREWVGLPELGLPKIKAKLDTGANYATLHAMKITPFERDGAAYVRFVVHPAQYDKSVEVTCEAPVVEKRIIKSSSGKGQERYVIRTSLEMGGKTWAIDLTLTNRLNMRYRMLLGRMSLKKRFVVCSSRSYLLQDEPQTAYLSND
ncbi:MAG: ATP-dependent zinc protease [Proteobacteria bacterium]|nr:ATP-dependent zinc protease [Pseudomonadota bacterium]